MRTPNISIPVALAMELRDATEGHPGCGRCLNAFVGIKKHLERLKRTNAALLRDGLTGQFVTPGRAKQRQ